jgi:AraC-like DNA-binding protein
MDGVPPADRHAAWSKRNRPNVVSPYETTPLVPFNTNSEFVQLDRLSLSYIYITGQRWQRSAARVRNSPQDSITINISRDFVATGKAGTRSFEQVPGSALVADLSKMSHHESSSGNSILIVVERDVIQATGLNMDDLHGMVISPKRAAILREHLLQLHKALPYLMWEEASLVAKTIINLFVLIVKSKGWPLSETNGPPITADGVRARNEITRFLSSPMLTIDNLSRQLKISRSTLYRLFKSEGGIQAYIRNERLTAAQQLLSRPDNDDSLTDIAEHFGFSDLSHFSRSFRARFGESPSDFRDRLSSDE